MKLELSNNLNAEEYNKLREELGWEKRNIKLVQKAITESAFVKKATIGNDIVGMARVISDGIYALIVDVAVSPNYQRKGIGKMIINDILNDIKNNLEIGETISVNLISIAGKEGFYEKFGFEKVPYEYTGYGMKMKIKKESD